MGKFILTVAVFFLAWWLLRRYLRSLPRDEAPRAAAEDMVRCDHCGVHLPRSESRASGEKFFCKDGHAHLNH